MKILFIISMVLFVSSTWAKTSFTCTPIEGFYPNNHSGLTGITFESAANTTQFTNFIFLKVNYSNRSEAFIQKRIDSSKTTQIELHPINRINQKAFILIDKSPREINTQKKFSGVLFLAKNVTDMSSSFAQIQKEKSIEIFNFTCIIP